LLKANPGKVRLIFKNNPLPFHQHASLAHEAALAAGAQGKFWEMHDLLFANQEKLAQSDLLRYAQQLSLDLPSFQSALESHIYRESVEADVAEAKGLGVAGTPTFFINGRKLVGVQSVEALKAAVDQALGLSTGHVPAGSPAEGAPGAATGATQPGPIEKVEIGDSPARGTSQATVTIVEFSDFQCPFCSRAVPTLQELLHEYPTGVRWVLKSFPLEFHPDSLLAHKAALAAGEQRKFWEMHDLIFANPGAIKRNDLIEKARQLGLDMKRFTTDLDSDRVQSIIQADKAEGTRLGVTGTPTFFINGKRMVGAWPLADYKKLVEAELHGGKEKPAAALPPLVVPKETKRPTGPSPEPPHVTKGPETAPVTITWYCDLESPLSPRAAQVVSQVMAGYPDKTRLVFKNLPMDFHPHAVLAHQALLAAGAQGKFWQMQQLILADQNRMTRDDLIADAKALGLNQAKFVAALDGRLYQSAIDEDAAEARGHGVYGVPVFFVNGKRMDGLQPLATFKQVVEAELARVQTVAAGQ
jgi:protein-disulfide isomerase